MQQPAASDTGLHSSCSNPLHPSFGSNLGDRLPLPFVAHSTGPCIVLADPLGCRSRLKFSLTLESHLPSSMSWEDDLASGRGPAPPLSGRPASGAGRRDEADPFSERGGPSAAPAPASAMSAADRAADFDSMLSNPAMSPPVFGGPALAGAMRLARDNAAERAALRSALFQTRSEDQERRAAIQAAQGGEIEEAEQALANSATPQNPRRKPAVDLVQPLPPLPTLTELQSELLAQVSQSDPPPKVVEFAPLEDRLQTWFETNADLDEQSCEAQIKVLLKQYRDTREQAARGSKRVWTTNQHLHAMSIKLAAITQLKDFDALDSASGGANAAAPAGTSAADTYFYDLHTLDLDSYADIKHLHRSSIAAGVGGAGGTGAGWWRTQLRELDEDLSEKRRRDLQILKEIENPVTEDGYEVPHDASNCSPSQQQRQPLMERINGGGGDISRATRRSSARASDAEDQGMLLARNRLADEAELEADLLASDLRASGLERDGGGFAEDRPSQQQLLARTQGRSYRSSSTATEVLLPDGQRIMRQNPSAPKTDPDAPQTPPTKARAMRDMENAMDQEAQDVKKPARKQR